LPAAAGPSSPRTTSLPGRAGLRRQGHVAIVTVSARVGEHYAIRELTGSAGGSRDDAMKGPRGPPLSYGDATGHQLTHFGSDGLGVTQLVYSADLSGQAVAFRTAKQKLNGVDK